MVSNDSNSYHGANFCAKNFIDTIFNPEHKAAK